MDFVIVEGRTLRSAMKPLMDVIERRTTIPILGYVRLSASGSTLRIEATDLDIFATATIDVIDSGGEWQACIRAPALMSIARVAGVMPIQISLTENGAQIELGDNDAVYDVGTLPVSDFPEGLSGCTDEIETFTNGHLTMLLDKVRWCISTEETRYYLNGIAWQFRTEGRRMVATDGHRMAICRYSGDPSNRPSVIIPRKTVAVLCAHFAGKDVRVLADKTGQKAMAFHRDGLLIRSKLIDGTFPDVDRVIPQESRFSFTMKRGELIEALKRACAMSGERFGRAVRFFGQSGKLAMEANNPDMGTSQVRTSTSWPAAATTDFGFNGRYVLDIADHCEGEMSFAGSEPGAPFTVSDADNSMTRVIMPMRV